MIMERQHHQVQYDNRTGKQRKNLQAASHVPDWYIVQQRGLEKISRPIQDEHHTHAIPTNAGRNTGPFGVTCWSFRGYCGIVLGNCGRGVVRYDLLVWFEPVGSPFLVAPHGGIRGSRTYFMWITTTGNSKERIFERCWLLLPSYSGKGAFGWVERSGNTMACCLLSI
jgi:hypothetical protein